METIQPLLEQAQLASSAIRSLADQQKQQLLQRLAAVLQEHTTAIMAANHKDLERMPDSDPKKDRLLLNAARIQQLADSLQDIARLPDPSSQLLMEKTLDNGLLVQKRTAPLGVVGVIYESRPNVTVDVAALCIRSGNACVLRGGSDAFYTNTCLVELVQQVLQAFKLPAGVVQLLPTDRNLVMELLTAVKYVDIIIPRGSQQLIEFVREMPACR